MGKVIIYRGNVPLDLDLYKDLITVVKAEHRQELGSIDQISLDIESENPLIFNIHDSIYHEGRRFKLNMVPELSKNSTESFSYKLIFESSQYDLIRKKMFNADEGGFKNTLEFPLTGPIQTHLQMLITNANRQKAPQDPTWVLGEYPNDTDQKTLNYSNVNCLQALQNICKGEQGFSTEFQIVENLETNTITLNIKKLGQILPYSFSYGMGKGLYKLSRTLINSGIVTRLFVYGSTENIPTNYRDFSDRLRLPESFGEYIQDDNLVNEFGLIEEAIMFDDIKPTFKGIITSVEGTTNSGQTQIKVDNMDFDLNEKKGDGISTKYLIPDTPAKIHVNKGNLAGYEFEIGEYNHATKTFKINPFTDTRGLVFPGTDPGSIFKFAPGDEFVILDIIMPEIRITEAEIKLKEKGLEEYEKVSKDNVKYQLDIDPLYLEALGPETNIFLRIGDYIRIYDSQLNIDKTTRITSLTRDLLNPYKYNLEISDSYEINVVQTILTDIQSVQTQVQEVTIKNKEAMLYGYKRMALLKGLIFDPDGYFDPTNIKPGSIETGMISVGARSQQLSLDRVIFTPNLNSNKNSIQISNGTLNHFSIDDSGIKSWTLNGLTQNNLLDSQSYYIYARVPRNGNTGNFLVTPQQIKFDAELSHYNFLLAVLFEPTNNMRFIELMYGATYIHGREIKTGRISSVDGLTWFDLDTGQIKGKIEFLPDSPAFEQVNNAIVIGGRNFALGTKTPKSSPTGWITYPISPDMTSGDYFLTYDYTAATLNPIGVSLGNESGFDGTLEYTGNLPAGAGKFSQKITFVRTTQTHLCIYVNAQTEVRNLKLEKGTKATDWTPAPEDIAADIQTVQNYAETVNNLVSDIASDNKLTPSEKQQLKREFDIIVAEKPQVEQQALAYGNAIISFRTAYNNAYLNLNTFISPLLVNLNNTSDVDGVTLRSRFTTYYTAKVNLLKAITDLVNNNLISIWDEVDSLNTKIDTELEDVRDSINDLDTYVNGAFSDGIISQAEAVAIEKYKNQLNAEKVDLENQYNQIIANQFLSGTPKTNLQNHWGTFNNDYNSLITSINGAIADGATTPAEKANVDAHFGYYRNSLGLLAQRFQEATKAIETAMIEAVQVGSVNLFRNSRLFALGANGVGLGTSVLRTDEADHYHRATPAAGKAVSLFGFYTMLENGIEYVHGVWVRNNGSTVVNLLTYSHAGNPNGQAFRSLQPNVWTFIKSNVIKGTGQRSYFILISDVANAAIDYKKAILVKGNKLGNDWTPAPEDIDVAIAGANANAANALAQAQNAINTAAAAAAVTSFMQTTIDGNVVSTGTLQVGDVNSANAGISGVTDMPAGQSVRFWAGGTYAGKNTARWNISDDGVERTFHPNGQLATIRGIVNGKYTYDWYHQDGFLLFKLDPNRGLVNVAYTQESWTPRKFIKLPSVSPAVSDAVLAGQAVAYVTGSNGMYQIESTQMTYQLWEYHNGTIPSNAQYEANNGYKTSNTSRTANIPNGWYITRYGALFLDAATSKPVVDVTFIQNGVETSVRHIILQNLS